MVKLKGVPTNKQSALFATKVHKKQPPLITSICAVSRERVKKQSVLVQDGIYIYIYIYRRTYRLNVTRLAVQTTTSEV